MITRPSKTQALHLGVLVVTVLREVISGLMVFKFKSDKYHKKRLLSN